MKVKNYKKTDRIVKNVSDNEEELFSFLEERFDPTLSSKFRDFVYNFGDDFESYYISKPPFSEKTAYGGALSQGFWNNFINYRGVYNPEQISYDIFDRMMRDPQIAMGYSILVEPIRALNYIIQCSDEYARILVKQALSKIWNRFIRDTTLSLIYGFSAFEKVFKYEHIQVFDDKESGGVEEIFNDVVILYDKLKNVHPSTVMVALDSRENYNGFIQKNRSEIINIPLRKSAWYAFNFRFGNYYGESILRNVYKYWYWGELLYQFMLRYYEMCGTPPVIVVVPKGFSIQPDGTRTDNLTIGLNLGKSLLSNSIAVLPFEPKKGDASENQWSIDRMIDDKRGPMFVDAIVHINLMKLIGIFVPENIAAQEITERDALFFTQESLITSIEDFVNQQIIPPLIHYNIPKDNALPCSLKFDKMSRTKKMMFKEIFVEMIRSLRVLQREGIKPNYYPDIETIGDQLEVPLKNYNDVFDDSGFVSSGKSEKPGDVESDFDFEKKKFPKQGRGSAKKEEKINKPKNVDKIEE